MLEVVAAYEGEGPPPPELKYQFDFERTGVLPNAGGLRDQVYGELDRMRACRRMYSIWDISRTAPAKWGELSPEDWRDIMAIRDARERLGHGRS